jgi:serine/threonine protein kinase
MPAASPPTIGPYRLLRPIGRGSMGVVHLALDTAAQRHVALKTLPLPPDAPADDPALQRFLGEVDAARRLSHPDIVVLHGAGRHQGTAWLAMELLSGCELGRYTRAPRLLPEPLVLHIGQRLARALAHAHAQGVVHRDIKPGNVMLDLPTGALKLTDFGVAGLADHSRTRTGVVLGTPHYMAPEQLAGAEADARSDLYSLGVLMFQLLCGRLPHEQASLGELLRSVARDPAPDLRTLRPDLQPAVVALVARALHKQPAQRHGSCAELADALAALSQAPHAARPTGPAMHNQRLADPAQPASACP